MYVWPSYSIVFALAPMSHSVQGDLSTQSDGLSASLPQPQQATAIAMPISNYLIMLVSFYVDPLHILIVSKAWHLVNVMSTLTWMKMLDIVSHAKRKRDNMQPLAVEHNRALVHIPYGPYQYALEERVGVLSFILHRSRSLDEQYLKWISSDTLDLARASMLVRVKPRCQL